MKIIKYLSSILLLVFILFISCQLEEPDIKETPSNTGTLDFSKYVAIGNSLTAGVQSGSLVEEHQKYSFPNLIAQQLGIDDFEQPTVAYPGIPNLMTLESVTGTLGTAPGTGVPTNLALARPYDNMGIPGIVLADVDSALSAAASYSHSAAIDLVLRGLGTQLQQALSLQPKLITCWIGNNDVLGYATSGGVNPPAPTDANIFAFLYNELATALAASGAKVAVANIPNVNDIPFFTTLPGVVLDENRNPVIIGGNMVPIIGVNPMADLVLLTAAAAMKQGLGIPAALGGTDQPLPDQYFLDAAERATVDAAITAYNQTIKGIADQNNFALVDLNEFFNTIVTNKGLVVPGSGLDTLKTDYISGGLFSLDGVHPTNIGHGVVANKFIEGINEKFGTKIQSVNLREIVGMAPQAGEKYDFSDPTIFKNTVHILGGSIE